MDKYNIIPLTFSKTRDFYTIRSVLVMTACWFLPSSSTFFWRKDEYFYHFLFFKVDFNKYTVQWPMGHSRDDVVHKILHKMKTYQQNQLKSWVLVYLKFSLELYKEIDAILIQCPFNIFQTEQFSAVKFAMGYEENICFLVIPCTKSPS